MQPAAALVEVPEDGTDTFNVLMDSVITNYGICRNNAAQLTGLQQWVREVVK